MFTIILKDLKFYSHHGLYTLEQEVGNEFIFNAKISYHIHSDSFPLSMDDTINYEKVYDIVKRKMEIPHDLLENLLRNISDEMCKTFPEIKEIQLRIYKVFPVLKTFEGKLGMEYIKKK